ncbi:MAG: hypothetical protein ABIW76_12715 [Fibrobacteria bacterium]
MNPSERHPTALFLTLLLLHFGTLLAMATPSAPTLASTSPNLEEVDTDNCAEQNSPCALVPFDPWPASVYRLGFTAMVEGNFMPVRTWSGDNETIWRLNLPIGIDFNAGRRNWRIGILIAPIGLRLQSDKLDSFHPVRRFIGQGVYLSGGWRGIHLTLASPEFDWSGKQPYKLSRTTLGLGLVLARLPQWGRSGFMPEWFGR